MLSLLLEFEDGRAMHQSLALPALIGRGRHCDLQIPAWRVAREHARVLLSASGVYLEDTGSLLGTTVNGRRIAHYGPLRHDDEILIGPCRMRVEGLPRLSLSEASGSGHPVPAPDGPEADTRGPDRQEPQGDQATESAQPVSLDEGRAPATVPQAVQANDPAFSSPAKLAYQQRLHGLLLQALDLRRRDLSALSDQALRAEALLALRDILQRQPDFSAAWDAEAMMQVIVDEAVGLGPLEPLLAQASVTEIMVNRHDEIYVEEGGRLRRHAIQFSSEQAVLGVLDRIVSPLGRRIDDSSPMVDARLPDGSRVNAVIPPIALRGVSLTIRKFPQRRLDMTDLLSVGALDAAMAEFLAACVVQRRNIIVAGGTGSGKTTLLNVLSNCIPAAERIVTIEDAAELRLNHAHLVALEARPANLEGRGVVTIRDLVRNALRMRPDRIVVGECRGGEAFDMLTAMNTGHEGSLTTLHANTPRDALSRLETMILMAGMELPLSAVREHIAASTDLIVQQVRSHDGRRRISAIVEVTGMESGRIQMQDLFRYEAGPPAVFAGCQVMPEFLSRTERLQQEGPVMEMRLFNQRTIVTQTQGVASFSFADVEGGTPHA